MIDEGEAGENRIRRQRDLAAVTVVLAAALTAAMLWDNFCTDPRGLKELREAVRQHRGILAEHREILNSVEAARRANEREWENVQIRLRSQP